MKDKWILRISRCDIPKGTHHFCSSLTEDKQSESNEANQIKSDKPKLKNFL